MKEKLVGSLLAVLLIPASSSASTQSEQAKIQKSPVLNSPMSQVSPVVPPPGQTSEVINQPSSVSPRTLLNLAPQDRGTTSVKQGEYQLPSQKLMASNSSSHQPKKSSPSTISSNSPGVSTQPGVQKVGEYNNSPENLTSQDVIAKIQAHPWNGQPAATLYIRDIPVLTFVGSTSSISSPQKSQSSTPLVQQVSHDPVWRATTLASKVNELSRLNVDPHSITVRWQKYNFSRSQPKSDAESYIIAINGEDLVEINGQTVLPDSTKNKAEDALQAANRLRRLLGNAPPLDEIAGKPKPADPIATGFASVMRFTGLASWYGPGFHGNLSANGEIFNENAMTAAHKELPFGTMVLVTNLENGRRVVVRINDRGPYVGDRIIDLSAGAARVLGIIDSGVANVQLDILNPQQVGNLPQ